MVVKDTTFHHVQSLKNDSTSGLEFAIPPTQLASTTTKQWARTRRKTFSRISK
jgi:hypothetical protein